MAFGKRFHTTYYSHNGDEYTLEIHCDGYGGSSTEVSLGSSGCVLNYEADGDLKYTEVVASNCTIPLIVENVTIQTFITELQETYQEKDVYVFLYNDNDATRPLWSGFILMDLAAAQDVSFPYQVSLKAVDGLSLLKDVDWVKPSTSEPYTVDETYAQSYQRITTWIQRILEKTGCALTTQGSNANYTYQTSVNWYNDKHAAATLANDPLFLTQCKMDCMYKVDDDGIYTVPSTYDVLVAICRSWGMRCVYWNHIFFFTQIEEYSTNESGTLANPDNLNTREYYYTGSHRLNQDYIGTKELSRYDLDFENAAAATGLMKLSGAQYNNYPIVKRVKTNYRIYEDVNAYQGFPLLKSTTPSTTYTGSTPCGVFWDMDDKLGWFAQFPVRYFVPNDGLFIQGIGFNARFVFSIRAKAYGAASWDKMLTETNGVLDWQSYVAPTTSSTGGMLERSINGTFGIAEDHIFFDSYNQANGLIPTDAAFTGKWEFEIYTFEYYNSSVSPAVGPQYPYHGGFRIGPFHINPRDYSANYSNVSAYSPAQQIPVNNTIININTNTYAGIFTPVTTTVIGGNVNNINGFTNTDNSYEIDINNLFWGDSSEIDIPSTLRVSNGSTWLYPDGTGDWGIGTVSGTKAFVELLCESIINNQSKSSLKLNCSTALSVNNKTESGYIKFLNPIARLKDLDNKLYVMLRGSLETASDQWQGEWFEFQSDTNTVTFVTNTVKGFQSGSTLGGGVVVTQNITLP